MKAFGRELEFISRIERDGSGTTPVEKDYIEKMNDDEFRLMNLSLSQKTFIAGHMNVFVVKLKNEN